MLAQELHSSKGGACVIASRSKKSSATVASIFSDKIAYELSGDLAGTALQGVLKNIYSIAYGMAVQKKYGLNQRSILSLKIIEEMILINELIGFDATQVFSYAGISDFLATSSSQSSCHVQAGIAVAAGNKYKVCEGVKSMIGLKKRYPQIYKKIPIFRGIFEVLNKQRIYFILSNL